MDVIREFLTQPHRTAVIGMSPDATRPSNYVPKFLENLGHTIVPVHPVLHEISGWHTVRSLGEAEVDAVIIYLSDRIVDRFVREATEHHIPLIWLPLGVTTSLRMVVEGKGLSLVEDRCPKMEWERIRQDLSSRA